MDKEVLKKSVTVNLRCVTQSSKGGVNINSLQSDYKGLIGKIIPFTELGYQSLESFLRSIPDVVRLKKYKDGLCMVEGVADSSTAHIANLISRQKNTKSTKGNFKKPSMPIRKYHESWRSTSNNPEVMGKQGSKVSISNSTNSKVPLPKPKNIGVSTSTASKLTTINQNNMISQSNITKSIPSMPLLESNNAEDSNCSAQKNNVIYKQSNITKSNPLVPELKSKNTGVTSSAANQNNVKSQVIKKMDPLGEETSNSLKLYSSFFKDTSTSLGSSTASLISQKLGNQQNTTSESSEITNVPKELEPICIIADDTTLSKIERKKRIRKAIRDNRKAGVWLSKSHHEIIFQKIRKTEKFCKTEIALQTPKEKSKPQILLNESQVQDSCKILEVSPHIQKEQLKIFTLMNLKNVILSSKHGVLLNSLQRDYENMFGISIPYKELDYSSLEAFIQDIPDVIKLKKNKNGQSYVHAVSNETATDISTEFFNQCAVETNSPPDATTTTDLSSFHQREPSCSNFENTTVTNAVYKPSLNCFPKIKYSIASATFSSLLMMNLLLFGNDSYMETLKRGILAFDGFDFCEGSDKWKGREILFSMLSEDSLRECLKLLCIDFESDNKQELVNKLLRFLASPTNANSSKIYLICFNISITVTLVYTVS